MVLLPGRWGEEDGKKRETAESGYLPYVASKKELTTLGENHQVKCFVALAISSVIMVAMSDFLFGVEHSLYIR